jgi:mono/diheme cytochrome c family protein
MVIVNKNTMGVIMLCLLPLVITACGNEAQVSFSKDVQPILDKNCVECHGEGGQGLLASGLDLTSHESLMKGAQFGPMIIAGDAEGSNLVVLMEGRADPSISMPHGQRDPVGEADIQAVRAWVDQGAKNN